MKSPDNDHPQQTSQRNATPHQNTTQTPSSTQDPEPKERPSIQHISYRYARAWKSQHNNSITKQTEQAEKRNRKKMQLLSAIHIPQHSSCEPHQLHLLSFHPARRSRKAMSDFTADNAPPLALVLVERMAQTFDLDTSPVSPTCFPHHLSTSQTQQRHRKANQKGEKPTSSPVHAPPFAFSFVQYRTCSVPLLLPGKNAAICFHVMSCCSLSSDSRASSSSVNLALGPERGRGWGRDGGWCSGWEWGVRWGVW